MWIRRGLCYRGLLDRIPLWTRYILCILYILTFLLASRSSQLDWAHTNEIKHDSHALCIHCIPVFYLSTAHNLLPPSAFYGTLIKQFTDQWSDLSTSTNKRLSQLIARSLLMNSFGLAILFYGLYSSIWVFYSFWVSNLREKKCHESFLFEHIARISLVKHQSKTQIVSYRRHAML